MDKRRIFIRLTTDERAEIDDRLISGQLPKAWIARVMVILLSDDGIAPHDISKLANVSPQRVSHWRRVYQRHGLDGLLKKRRSMPRRYGPEITDAILALAAKPPPPGERWWTAKLIAEKISHVPWKHVSTVIRKAGIDLRAGRRRKFRY